MDVDTAKAALINEALRLASEYHTMPEMRLLVIRAGQYRAALSIDAKHEEEENDDGD